MDKKMDVKRTTKKDAKKDVKVVYTTTLSADLVDKLNQESEKTGKSKSYIINKALTLYINAILDEKKAMQDEIEQLKLELSKRAVK